MPPKPKTTPPATEATGSTDAASPVNKARAAFDEHRKRMADRATPQTKEAKVGPAYGPPVGGPFPAFPGPGWGLPPMMPPPPMAAPAGAIPLPPLPAMQAPLLEGVGQMLQLGVALATSVFAGGLQLMQGFNGGGPQSGFWPGHGHSEGRHPEGCGCGCGCSCDCGGHSTCGCGQSDCCDPCCTPGVHNCRC